MLTFFFITLIFLFQQNGSATPATGNKKFSGSRKRKGADDSDVSKKDTCYVNQANSLFYCRKVSFPTLPYLLTPPLSLSLSVMTL